MHPAPSIIALTTCTGAGYGLLFLLGLSGAAGLLPAERSLGVAGLGLALTLISVGLASSLGHLRRPDRAWRALSQWRSSWLSREGVMALVTYLPAGLTAVGWIVLEDTSGIWAVCGVASALGAAATVACTAMIYASLKPIRQWHNGWSVPLYLAFALATGAVWLTAVLHLLGVAADWVAVLALLATLLAWGLKLGYWRWIDRSPGMSTPETATGLGTIGKVRLLDPPHTEENYLLQEMGFRIARKHSHKLRRLALVFGLAGTLGLILLTFVGPTGLSTAAALLAALSASLGVVIERWLVFAEAKHTVMLYYGERSA